MTSIQKNILQNNAANLEKEITDFLQALPANDNICGVGFIETPEPTNDNRMQIDKREIGLDITPISVDEETLSGGSDNMQELNFEEECAGRRGFLAEDTTEFSY